MSRRLSHPFHHKSDKQSPQGSDPSDSNTFLTIPPEILDKILEYHGSPHKQRGATGPDCMRFGGYLVGRAQSKTPLLLNHNPRAQPPALDEQCRPLWIQGAPSQIRSFIVASRRLNTGSKYPMGDLARDSGEYLSALSNLHSLTFYNTRVEHIGEDQFHTCFSAFRETLTCLTLGAVATLFGAFVALVDYFPKVTTLRPRSFVLEPDEGPVPPLSRPLRGKLHVTCIRTDRSDFFDRFAELDLEYEDLEIDYFVLSTAAKSEFLQSALQISKTTVKSLRMVTEFRRE